VPLARKLSGALESDLYLKSPGGPGYHRQRPDPEQDFDQHWRKCPNWEILGRAVRLSENVVDLQRVND